MGFSRLLLATVVMAFSIVSLAESQAKSTAKDFSVTHKVGKDETAWFLSQVFYGPGKDFNKILDANQMKSPSEIVFGKEIVIKNPVYSPAQKDFSERYTSLWEKREKALAEKRASVGLKEVVVASKTVVSAKSIDDLPFTEVKDPLKSPMDKAKEELQKLYEKQSFKRLSGQGSEPF